jgi:hypothetical protein
MGLRGGMNEARRWEAGEGAPEHRRRRLPCFEVSLIDARGWRCGKLASRCASKATGPSGSWVEELAHGPSRCRLQLQLPVSISSCPLPFAPASPAVSLLSPGAALPPEFRKATVYCKSLPRLHQPSPTRRLVGLHVLHVLLTACEARQASLRLPHPCAS